MLRDKTGEPCPGCGASFEKYDGPVHRYFGESPACWRAYGAVLAKEYEDPEYWRVHRLTVDTYSVQHPFNSDRRNVQSVNIHLMALYVILELGYPFESVPALLGRAAKELKDQFLPIIPPGDLGPITVKDVLSARSAHEHCEMVWRWSRSVWAAWRPQIQPTSTWFQQTRALLT